MDTPEEVLTQARTAHLEEQGSIVIRYIPREKGARIEQLRSETRRFATAAMRLGAGCGSERCYTVARMEAGVEDVP